MKQKPQEITHKPALQTNLRVLQDKNGNDFAKFEVSIKGTKGVEVFPATKWRLSEQEKEILHNHDVIMVTGEIAYSDYSKQMELTISMFTPAKDDQYELSDLVQTEQIDEKVIYNNLVTLVNGFKNPILKKATLGVLTEFETELKTISAAMSMHHARPKGLILHVYEMINLGITCCKLYPVANQELVTAGIIFHDMMKAKEYDFTSYGKAKDFAKEGVLFGHVYMGATLPKRYVSDEEAQSEEIAMLEHIILAHHGQLEYGSPVKPATIEATIVHHVDNLDANMNKFAKELETMEKGELRQLGFSKGAVYYPNI